MVITRFEDETFKKHTSTLSTLKSKGASNFVFFQTKIPAKVQVVEQPSNVYCTHICLLKSLLQLGNLKFCRLMLLCAGLALNYQARCASSVFTGRKEEIPQSSGTWAFKLFFRASISAFQNTRAAVCYTKTAATIQYVRICNIVTNKLWVCVVNTQ